ncbi:hypothetical protein [Bradyrhizobium centrosematis]|uniref:hypothetical protein n=1 Tax=Bradyrhizobium centrosematis TaxID=1300039 RepID=UPI00388ED274
MKDEPQFEDVNKQGGWSATVKTPPSLTRYYYVYELDKETAKSLLKAYANVVEGETIEIIAPANIHALIGEGMKPGRSSNTVSKRRLIAHP